MRGELTPWFPADAKPTRKGVYELQGLMYPYHYWSGRHWLHIADSSPSAFTKRAIKGLPPMAGHIDYIKNTPWRGLASDPSKAVKP
jgi:hypothetical protein